MEPNYEVNDESGDIKVINKKNKMSTTSTADFPLGAVLLDLEERDLPSIAGRVVDQMIACDQIPQEQREAVIRVLLLRHRHIRDKESSFKLSTKRSNQNLENEDKIPNNSSSLSLDGGLRASVRKAGLSNLFHAHTFKRNTSAEDTQNVISNGDLRDGDEGQPNNRKDSYTQIEIEGDTGQLKDKSSKELMKKIPEGAEATAVLVGAVDFLKHPTIAFVRLAQGVVMDGLIEVPIPIRFMFVLLGPFHGEMDYHEVGRSISTLMSDKSFHEVAYRAHSRGQLLTAINEFLNASIVMPPSEWNNKDLLPIDDMRIKAQQLHLKKESLRARKKSEIVRADAPPPAAAGDGDGEKKRDPLVRHGKLFYGLIEDWKQRMPLYLSDIKDGLNGQTLAAAIFIYFASLSAAITFGGLYGDEMDNYIGVGETLLITSVNGIMMALCASQPLLIIGATGPLMIFDLALYSFCTSSGIEVLPMRFWIGFWMTVFGLLVACFELVAIVKKFTRFTEEIFSTLVCLIFIYEAFNKLGAIFVEHPLQESYGYRTEDNHTEIVSGSIVNGTLFNGTDINGTSIEPVQVLTPQPNTALLSLILMMGTFIIAIRLKAFRNSKFLGRPIRRALGDFGVPISIVLMVTLDYCMDDTYTDKISMPVGLSPSNPAVRGWLINPFGNGGFPFWCIFAACPASLLLFVLVFLEENICHLILSKPERNMKKGSGFHTDLVISCTMNLISGAFGAPFMTPAVVRTVSHTSALTVMSTNQAPGESAKIAGVIEQRVSALLVSLLVGLSVLLTPVLNLVPKPVLFGIFLYMGISSTAGIQFLERMFLFLMPVKHHPNVPYVKKLGTWKMHAFTGIQLALIVVLWVVKQSPAALCFPFVLMCLIPLRLYLLPLIFNHDELDALDGSGAHDSAVQSHDTEDLDFFEEAHDFPTHIDDEYEEEHNHNH
ncbi:unnamed protein product [Meganyctiphanes norvegica]|uniref:Anion exchange protein n=1 Tax=Meganyctiphanes norvegica TaxID=48144 RepID=A0AAV2RM58_MEGNR